MRPTGPAALLFARQSFVVVGARRLVTWARSRRNGDSRGMEADELIAVLEAGNDLMSVVSALGLDCLGQRRDLKHDQYVRGADTITTLRTMVATESPEMWSSDGAFVAGPSQTLKKKLAESGGTPPLATMMVLEGICLGAARIFFANASSLVRLGRGSVVPLPERWLPEIAETPHPRKTHGNLLDKDCDFILWDSEWVVELDYTFRDRLDGVCAVRRPDLDREIDEKTGKEMLAYALPKIASVHPFNSDAMTVDEMDKRRFFGVHPKLLPEEEVHDQVIEALAIAGSEASIAVLPEFCLHSPDGLDSLLAGSEHSLAPLVVAGSAHTGKEDRRERANTSCMYLDRHRFLSVSKYEPFVLEFSDAAGNDYSYQEDIAPTPRVLRLAAGTATRLAVAICSDLNSLDFLGALMAAGVNLLLSPSWTPKIGVNTAGLAALAGYSQCVGVVANTPGHPFAKEEKPPFWACSAVPREKGQARPHRYSGSPPAAGILDPNVIPPTADIEDPDAANASPADHIYWTWVT